MNGYYADTMEDLSEIFEDYEMDDSEDTEQDEARGRRGASRFRPPRTPTGRGLFRPRPKAEYVTQVQLQAAMDRVGAQIKANGDAVKQVNTRLNTIGTRIDDEAAARKKETAALRNDLKKGRELSLLPLLMQKAPTVETKSEKVQLQVGSSTVEREFLTGVTVKQSTDILLPLVLIMGMGDSGKSTDDNSMLLILAVMMSQQNK